MHLERPVEITRVQAYALRCPIDVPVATSFGVMRDRPAVFVRLEDKDGCFGFGEVFANWPAAGAEHRVHLLQADISDLVLGFVATAPSDLFHHLRNATRLRALQCGEFGPFRQVIAGLDIALWDLFARRAEVPVRRLLNPTAGNNVPVYASGIHIAAADTMIDKARQNGFADFKVKVGFDLDTDSALMTGILANLAPDESLAADANQAWDLEAAKTFAMGVGSANLAWLEEPIPAYASHADWTALSAVSPVPLAAGENIAGYDDFTAVLSHGSLGVVQPDVVKWGGLTGCYDVARHVLDAGARYCPHFLGGGIGLAASAELLAAAGGDGLLEVDVNPNPLREAFDLCKISLKGREWRWTDQPGLGITALPAELAAFQTAQIDLCL